MFTVKDGEPTDFALISIRVSGGIYLLLSAAIVLASSCLLPGLK